MASLTNSFTITSLFFLIATGTCVAALFVHPRSSLILRSNWHILLILFVVNLCIKIPFGLPFFHGLEYEDCFIHQAVARQLPLDPEIGATPNPFRETIYSMGSLDSGDYHQTFSHFIGYPTVINLVQRVIGDIPSAAHLVSLISSCILVSLVFVLARLISTNSLLAWLSVAFLTCIPVNIAFATATSSEIFSSVYLVLALLLMYLVESTGPDRIAKTLSVIALPAVLIFAVLIRRENALLLLLFPMLYYLTSFKTVRRSRSADTLRVSFLVLLLPVGFVLGVLDFSAIYVDELSEVGHAPFALKNMLILLPCFGKLFVTFRLYFAVGLLLVFVPLVWNTRKEMRPTILAFLSFIGLYAAHWRSYYFLETYEAGAWDCVRYSLNVMPLFAIVAASCMLWVLECANKRMAALGLTKGWTRIGLVIGSVGLALWCAAIALGLRGELTKKEQELRVGPVKESIRILTERHGDAFWLFTFEPCIVQIYGRRSLRSADLVTLEYYNDDSLRNIIEGGNAYVLLTDDQGTDEYANRYDFQIDWIRARETTDVYEGRGWKLVRLGSRPEFLPNDDHAGDS